MVRLTCLSSIDGDCCHIRLLPRRTHVGTPIYLLCCHLQEGNRSGAYPWKITKLGRFFSLWCWLPDSCSAPLLHNMAVRASKGADIGNYLSGRYVRRYGHGLIRFGNERDSCIPKGKGEIATRLLVAKILFGIALLPALVIADLRLLVFTQLGVRTPDTAISLDKRNLARLQSAADTAGIQLSVCRGEADYATVASVDVLWHASGTRSLVRIGEDQGVDIELNTDELKLIRGKVERCIELKESLLFNSGTAVLVAGRDVIQAGLNEELSPLIKDIKEHWKVKSIKVIGHADPMPLPLNGNESLAKQRAAIVKELLMENHEFVTAMQNTSNVNAISAAARQPIKQCNTNESAAYQRSCNETNRRVEIRFRLERIPAKQPKA